MKKEQNTQNSPQFVNLTQIKEQMIRCIKGNKAPFVYMNRKCCERPFVCEQKQCQCHSQHKKCIKAETSSILQNLLQNQFSSKDISSTIQKTFNSAIDLLSMIQDNLLLTIQKTQKIYQFIGLTKGQIEFIDAIKEIRTEDIQCQDVWNILMNTNQEIHAGEIFKIFSNKIEAFWVNLEKEIIQFGENVQRELKLINKCKIQYFENSKLIRTPEDQVKLIGFFDTQQIKSTTLLYRASQNDFQTEKFHQKCDGTPNTLAICQTEFGKIIGAFTPQEWYKNQKWEFFKDTSGQSFVYSLTNGDKFVNQNNEAGIVRRNDNTFGMQFGKNLQWDFLLANKANQNDRSLANINTGYKNRKYVKGDKNSFQKFIGNPNGYTFKVKEWEVWKIQFI